MLSNISNDAIGKNFYSCRGRDSLANVSGDCGLTPKTVGAIEVGSHGISCQTAIRLAKRYHKTMSDLCGWKPNKGYFTLEPEIIPIEELHVSNFAPQFDKICRERSISSQLISERTDIARSTVNAYRIGRRKPSLTGLLKIAQALNVSCDALLLPLTEEERKEYEKWKPELRREAVEEEIADRQAARNDR